MAAKFKLLDKHVAFCNAVVAGEDHWKAYLKFISPRKDAKRTTSQVNASKLMKRPQIKACIKRIQKEREEHITEANLALIPKEFTTTALTIDQMDSFHYSVALGLTMIEEHVVVYRVEEILNQDGKVAKRVRIPNIQKYLRAPNVREKQISIAEIYKRFGSYAPSKLAGWFKTQPGNEDDPGENVERFVLLSNGDKIAI